MARPELLAITSEPISLEMARDHLRIDADCNDSMGVSPDDAWLLDVGIPGSREMCEQFLGMSLARKTFRLDVESFPADGLVLHYPPIVSISSVEYADDSGSHVLDSSGYALRHVGEVPVLKPVDSWPEADPWSISVTYVTGYEPVAFPASLRIGLLLMLGHMYRNREAIGRNDERTLPFGIEWALRPHRIRTSMA